MVAISPFRALRFDPSAGELSRLIAPPYDVIGAEEQERLYQASPHNVVRLILGKTAPSDTELDNRYTRARMDFEAWCRSGVLREDAAPAIYLIEHRFTPPAGAGRGPATRLGFLALLELGDQPTKDVYRHEATLEGPKRDRTKLLQAVPANLEPIFCIYPDEGAAVQGRLKELTQRPATAQATLKGDDVRLWAVTDSALTKHIAARLASSAVLIADGHHRFEVACAHRQRYGAVMTYFVSMADPALVVRPIHRVVRHGGKLAPERLQGVCRVEQAGDAGALMTWLEAGDGRGRFGYFDGETPFRVTVQPEPLARWLMAPDVPLPLAALDVSLLHSFVFPGVGLSAPEVRYEADASEALRAVRQGGADSAWLLRGVPLAQVYALASQGLSLPPKSTYFYPKVPSGLAINPLVC
jgi:uncharacterized protein (DUF1015 family)